MSLSYNILNRNIQIYNIITRTGYVFIIQFVEHGSFVKCVKSNNNINKEKKKRKSYNMRETHVQGARNVTE